MLSQALIKTYNGFVGSVQPENSVLGNELGRKLGVLKCDYKFSRDGGAVSTIDLKLPGEDEVAATLPDNAVIWDGCIDVLTAVTSGGAAEMSLQANAADDLVIATVVAGAPWSTTGLKVIIPVGSVATAIKLTAARTIQSAVSVAVLTAGEFNVFLFYLLSD